LKHLSPIQVMQNWQQNKPEIFTSLVHNHTIPDNYTSQRRALS
jgi:hypothetical protein